MLIVAYLNDFVAYLNVCCIPNLNSLLNSKYSNIILYSGEINSKQEYKL